MNGEPNLWSRRGQAATWRAAARGYEADGDRAGALRCWNQARMILGLRPRVESITEETS